MINILQLVTRAFETDGNGIGCETDPFPSVFKERWLRH